jgi:type IV pilus assembly protein PilX
MKTFGRVYRQRERGAALVVSLLMLVIISVLGVAALRNSMFSSKVATGAQVGTMTFQAAETALAMVFEEATAPGSAGDPDNVLIKALVSLSDIGVPQVQYRCVTRNEAFSIGACDATSFMDSRNLLRAGSETFVRQDISAVPGFDISMWGQYELVTIAEGEMPDFRTSNINIQEYTRIAPLMSRDM